MSRVCHLAQVRTVVFDKTGTLTHGKPLVTRVVKFVSEEVCPRWLFLALMQSAEQSSEHPLGAAITKYAKACLGGVAVGVTDMFEVFPGQGLRAVVKHLEPLMAEQITVSKNVVHTRECVSSNISFTEQLTGSGGGAEESVKLTVVIGNRGWMSVNGVTVSPDVHSEMLRYESNGQTVVLMAVDGEWEGGRGEEEGWSCWLVRVKCRVSVVCGGVRWEGDSYIEFSVMRWDLYCHTVFYYLVASSTICSLTPLSLSPYPYLSFPRLSSISHPSPTHITSPSPLVYLPPLPHPYHLSLTPLFLPPLPHPSQASSWV